jgi:hypothetical protein
MQQRIDLDGFLISLNGFLAAYCMIVSICGLGQRKMAASQIGPGACKLQGAIFEVIDA